MSARLDVTNEANGLPSRRLSVDDVYEMARAGLLREEARVELIGGELVPMSPKGSFHERLKIALAIYWSQRLPPDLIVATETTFRLSVDTYLEPDLVFYPKAVGWDGLRPETASLVVEIGDSSLRYDRSRKTGVYAAFGVVELWVIDAVTRETRIHQDPAPAGYGRVRDVRPDEILVPRCSPGLAVTLAELDLH